MRADVNADNNDDYVNDDRDDDGDDNDAYVLSAISHAEECLYNINDYMG